MRINISKSMKKIQTSARFNRVFPATRMLAMLSDRDHQVGDAEVGVTRKWERAEVDVEGRAFPVGVPPKWSY
jgi:hypothetical protein